MENQKILSRKERERLARRDDILNAARQVFSERGFKMATLDEIAEVAEFGKGTIYNYFENKEDLFVSVIERGIGRFQDFVAQAVSDIAEPREKIEAYIDAAIDFFEKHRQIFSILELERQSIARNLNDAMFQRFCNQEAVLHDYLAKIFRSGIRKGVFISADSMKLAQTLFGLMHIAYIHAVREPERWDLRRDADFIKRLFLDGVTKK